MRFLAFAFSCLLLLPAATAADSLPSPRTGGAYDLPLLVRPGIDDFGLTLGQFASCAEQTIAQAVADGWRPPPDKPITLKDAGATVTLVVPGQTQDVRLTFRVAADYVLMSRFRAGRKSSTDPNVLWQAIVLLANACALR